MDVAGRSLLEHALAAVPEAAQLVIVAPESHLAESRALAPRAVVVAGGDTRQASVAAGLAGVVPGIRTVLVHDAARAFTPAEVFERVIAAVASTGGGVIPVLPVIDTMALEARLHRRHKSGLFAGLFANLFGRNAAPLSIRLADSRARYHLPRYRAHHALTDALATAELLQAQIAHHFKPDTTLKEVWA